MIDTPTVLILGAGTSMDYAFPSARGLKSDICERFEKPDSEGINALCDAGGSDFETKDFTNFCRALRMSGQSSVDAFLERNPAYVEIGKLALAYCLIRYETEDTLFPQRSEQHLYEYIFNRLGSDISAFRMNRLAVLTFNYDRSLEHFLATALYNSNQSTASHEQAQEALQTLPIVHLYGQLAPLAWQARNHFRQYKADPTLSNVVKAAQYIKIISDKRDNDLHKDPEFLRAWELMDASKRICFLGFSYHSTNLSRLRIDNSKGKWEIYGTTLGLAGSEQAYVKRELHKPTLGSDTSLTFLRHYGILG